MNNTCPITSIVFQGDLTTKFRIFGVLELLELPPMKYFRKGNKTPAMSRIEVKCYDPTLD